MYTYKEFLTESVKFSPDTKISGMTFNAPLSIEIEPGSFSAKVNVQNTGSDYDLIFSSNSKIIATIDLNSKTSIYDRLVEAKVKTAKVVIYDGIKKNATKDTFSRISRSAPYHIQCWSTDGECLFEAIFK